MARANPQDVRYPWRVGSKVGRTIYVQYHDGVEALIGVMDSPDLAQAAVNAHNLVLSVIQTEASVAELSRRLAPVKGSTKDAPEVRP